MIFNTNDIMKINSDPEARRQYDKEVEERTLKPVEVDISAVHLCTNQQISEHFREMMEDCEKGKITLSGTVVVTNERKREVRVVNFLGRKPTHYPSWDEHRVKLNDLQDTHRFRIAMEENSGLEFSRLEQGPGEEYSDEPPQVQVYNGFKNYTNLAAHLIPQQKTTTQRKVDREIAKFKKQRNSE